MTIRNNEFKDVVSLRRRVLRSVPDLLTSCRVSLIRVVMLFLALMLSGCEEVGHAVILNRVDTPIVIHWQSENIHRKIQPDEDVEIAWKRGCVTIVEGDKYYHFDSRKIPVKLIEFGFFNNVIKVLYRHGELSYVNANGERSAMPEMKSCENILVQ
jgi:hypothetical protein